MHYQAPANNTRIMQTGHLFIHPGPASSLRLSSNLSGPHSGQKTISQPTCHCQSVTQRIGRELVGAPQIVWLYFYFTDRSQENQARSSAPVGVDINSVAASRLRSAFCAGIERKFQQARLT